MKFLKISLAASLALGALSTASFAQPLEEAIKGVDVSGYLRYRYTDDRYDNAGFSRDSLGGSNARHQWRAEADFKTPTINNVAMNLGVFYKNENQNVNHGKNGPDNANGVINGTGNALGAGQDSDFGVSQFYMTITPDSTATTILIGKQKLGTPVTNPGDGDRGTGILALNSDISGLTLAAGAFDSWAIDDATSALGDEYSVDKPLYTLAAIYGVDTSIGNIGAQVWGFMVDDIIDAMIYSELSWKHSVFNASLQYGYAKIQSGLEERAGNHGQLSKLAANVADTNDLLNLRIGANFKEYNVPLGIQLGYLTNFQDGTTVSVDDEGAWTPSIGGKIWWQNSATGVTFGLMKNMLGMGTPWGEETDLSVFHGVIDYTFLDGRFKIGLEGAFGENERTDSVTGATNFKTKFTEITPTVSWKHSKNLTISGFYAMLSTERDTPAYTVTENDEDRNRARVEVKYTF